MEAEQLADLFRVALGRNLNLDVHVEAVLVGAVALIALLFALFAVTTRRSVPPWLRRFEIDEAELGVGQHKVVLRPNTTDLQIAYKLWIELSTRKIGLPIALDHDVISEIYDSWYRFFAVTREHLKGIPANRLKRKETEQIIRLSIDVLNLGVRPHLTRWQARFRRWYQQQLEREENLEADPQSIQAKFPQYAVLVADLRAVNERLIRYREKLYQLLVGQ